VLSIIRQFKKITIKAIQEKHLILAIRELLFFTTTWNHTLQNRPYPN